MEDSDREKLRLNRETILKDVLFKDVKHTLFAGGVLSQNDIQEVESGKTDRDQMATLLDVLPRRGPDAYVIFCKALENTHPWVIKALADTNLVVKMEANKERVREPYTEVNREVLRIVTKSTALREYKRVVRALGLQQADLDQIEYGYPMDLYEQFYQCLIKWISREGKAATIDRLKSALREEEFIEVADILDGY